MEVLTSLKPFMQGQSWIPTEDFPSFCMRIDTPVAGEQCGWWALVVDGMGTQRRLFCKTGDEGITDALASVFCWGNWAIHALNSQADER
jgi:hypothetical protein